MTENQAAADQNREHEEKLPRRRRFSGPALFLAGIAIIMAAAVYFTTVNRAAGEIFTYHHLAMDTGIELALHAASRSEAEAAKAKAFAEMARLEQLLSRSIPASDVNRVNEAAGAAAVRVAPETIAVLEAALKFASLSNGAFDPTVSPLLDRWGFLGKQPRVPSETEIKGTLLLVDSRQVAVDRAAGAGFLPVAGMGLDLGGIAKGYIVDQALARLADAGIQHACLSAGGDICLLGPRPDGSPWRIGIRHPREAGQLIGVLPLSGGAVVTSGDYERAFTVDGKRYHHILDPATGLPASSLASVTIVALSAMEAVALSTAGFVLGPERGVALVESLPGVEAVLVTPDLEVLVSTGLKDKLELR